MSRGIYIAKGGATNPPVIPPDAVTRTFGIFGVKRSGKTTTARSLAEGIVKLGGHVVILDPVGVWWGITRAGEGPGLPGVVIGGEHADIPLEETGGELVAEFVASRQQRVVVVDMQLLRKGEQRRFMADFLETLYHINRRPLQVMIEEADRALPQNPRGNDPVMSRVLGAAEDIVKLGGSRGLGSTFLSQRMATVTKNVTEQVEALILHAQPGPRDRKAVKDWVEANGDPKQTAQVMDSMASLPVGEAWLYSPAWMGVLARVKIKAPKTLDSSATPTDDPVELDRAAPRAPVDLDGLRSAMAETVERAKANNPKALRARITELEKALAKVSSEGGAGAAMELGSARLRIEELEREVDRLARVGAAGRELHNRILGMGDDARALTRIADSILNLTGSSIGSFVPEDFEPPARSNGAAPRPPAAAPRSPSPAAVADHEAVNVPRQRILDTIAWFDAIGVSAPRRAAVGPLAGSSATSSGFEKNLSGLRTAGLIDYPEPGRLSLTAEGRALAQAPDGRPTNADLHAAVLGRLNPPRRAILEALLGSYPEPLSRADLAAKVGVSASSSGFEKNLSGMRTLEFIDYPSQGLVVAADLLFI